MPDIVLNWFPKRFGAGDMAGQGAQRLLGQPNLSRGELLVREMAQNSWDARLGDVVPEFGMHLRNLPPKTSNLLRRLLSEGDGGLGLHDALSMDQLRVIEIHDRGTRGLGGPVRNDIVPRTNEPTDFADFVLTLGAPRDKDLGGGTFGFGKTAAYTASSCGSVVIWTRTRTPVGLEHRLIVSAFGDAFDMDGVRYTGRHWWGMVRDGSVEPLIGAVAEELGSALFDRGFEEDESGTSLLIIAPLVDDKDDEDALVRSWRQSVVTHLWPKILDGQDDARSMRILLRHNGVDVPLVHEAERPLLGAKGAALGAVRSAQAGGTDDAAGSLVKIFPVERSRPRRVLGHVAFSYYTPDSHAPDDARDDEVGAQGSNSVVLMRHDAELVVKHLVGEPMPNAGLNWVGVFKPLQQLDDVFAAAEPPSHDDWIPGGLPREERLTVKNALDLVNQKMRDLVNPVARRTRSSQGVSAGEVSNALAALAGGAPGGRASGRANTDRHGIKARKGAPPREGQISATVTSWEFLPTAAVPETLGRRSLALTVETSGGQEALVVTPVIAFGAEGGSVTGLETVDVSWMGGTPEGDGSAVRTIPGEPLRAIVTGPADVALEVTFHARAAQ